MHVVNMACFNNTHCVIFKRFHTLAHTRSDAHWTSWKLSYSKWNERVHLTISWAMQIITRKHVIDRRLLKMLNKHRVWLINVLVVMMWHRIGFHRKNIRKRLPIQRMFEYGKAFSQRIMCGFMKWKLIDFGLNAANMRCAIKSKFAPPVPCNWRIEIARPLLLHFTKACKLANTKAQRMHQQCSSAIIILAINAGRTHTTIINGANACWWLQNS